MNRSGIRGVDLKPVLGRAGRGIYSGCGECFFDEQYFREMIRRERKRSQCSGKPLVLMRLEIAELVRTGSADVGRIVKKVFETGIRETDVCGWCAQETVAGILFTDIETVSHSVMDTLFKRLMGRLACMIDPSELFKIRATFHVYPMNGAQCPATEYIGMDCYNEFAKRAVTAQPLLKFKTALKAAGKFLMA